MDVDEQSMKRSKHAGETKARVARSELGPDHRPPSPVRVPGAKRAYRPPTLAVFGGVSQLTHTVGSRGRNDMRGRRKTGY
jgi:hypothetical protein